jgi:hypothetical protein
VTLLRDIANTLRADPREAFASLAVCVGAGATGYLLLLLGN